MIIDLESAVFAVLLVVQQSFSKMRNVEKPVA